MREPVEVQVLRSSAELAAFAPAWAKLWANDPNATPFQHPAWLLSWWHQFGQPELRAAVVCAGGEPVALLPFYLYREPESGERKLMPMGVGTSDYLDGLFAPTCSPALAECGLRAVCAEPGWDALYGSQLRAGSPLLAALERTPALRYSTESTSRMPALRLAELPQKIRRNAMYYRNRAQRAGVIALATATEPDCLAAFDELVRLHTTSWQARGEPGVLADPHVLAWHREALPQLARAGLLRLKTLRLNGEAIAAAYALADPAIRPDRSLYVYLTAFSPAHAELRPGTLLLAGVLEHAAEDGFRTTDMLRGDESYKAIWHTERSPTYGFTLAQAQAETLWPEAAERVA